MEVAAVGHRMVSCFKSVVAVLATSMVIAGPVFADSRSEVLERIKPVGTVAIEGQAAPASTTAPADASTAAPAEATTPAAEAEKPAASAPVAKAAPAADGAALYVAKGCTACHGADGRKTLLPTYPKVAGLPVQYAYNQMLDIKSGARNNGQSIVMKGIVAGVDDKDLKTIAEWLGNQ
jgi:cytochrome c553